MRVAVVGAGITGLVAAYRTLEEARTAERPLQLTVLESEDHLGGHAWTFRDDEFLVEAGPNAFLDRVREPETLELVRSLGLEPRVIEARAASRRRFVFHRGQLRRVPDSPPALVASNALSIAGKLRLLLEPWARAAADGVEESVYDFARRRIGREAAEVLVDAAISGISAGDSRRLSVASAFPLMIEMERDHGSLIRAMIARRHQRPPRLMSFDGGMETLIGALASRLGGAVRLGCPVRRITRADGAWRLILATGEDLAADQVVLALPAGRAARLVEVLDPLLARALGEIPFAGIAMVAMAFRESDSGPLDGYGYLVSRADGLDTLGVVWESSLFDGRAPRGTVLLRAMMGGVRRPETVARSEAALVESARRELAGVLGISAAPLRAWVKLWPQAIAQYELGHAARVEAVRQAAERHPGLLLCGTSYDGVSFTRAVASGLETGRRVAAALDQAARGPAAPTSPHEPVGEKTVIA